MLTKLYQALPSPLPLLAAALRTFWRHGGRIRRARVLAECADGLRLRRVAGWEARSGRLYRRSIKTLGALAATEGEAGEDPGLAARRALREATAPYRALFPAGLTYAGLLAAVALLLLLAAGIFSSSFRTWLFPRDLAAGRPWTASNADFGFPTSSNGPAASDKTVFFHTSVQRDPWVEIDLGAEHVIRGLRVENRTDCCQERALPLNVEVWDGHAWQLVFQRRAAFSVWRENIGPVRARRIRFLRPGTDYFHLKSIRIYGE
jgi:hypothetical protein